MRMLIAAALTPVALASCAPYEAMPTSGAQWERRQTEIEYREQERQRLCAMIDRDSDRWKRDCDRPGAAD